MNLTLDALIQQRTGGAVNIRGIRFQILYTLWRALRAHTEEGLWRVSPEGLEDVDVQIGGVTEHVQVKTSKNRWAPHELKKALTSIVEAARACEGDPTHTFSVLLAGDVNDGIQALATRETLPAVERAAQDAALEKLLRKAGASEALAGDLSRALTLQITEPDILDERLRHAVTRAFNIHPASADLVVQALSAFVLGRAYKRKPFGPSELARAYAAIAEGEAITSAFEARGRSLINPIDWTETQAPGDFMDGRGTHPGHIASDLDVERPRWIERISEILDVTRLCIIRAPSGQGKSALAFRFARDHWNPEATLSLAACSTPEDAAQVAAYLRARADLGLPTALLIDGADWRLQHWPDVAAVARDHGIPVLATVRVEDWRRFAVGSAVDLASDLDVASGGGSAAGPLADAAIVEPYLDLDEARSLFRRLRRHDRIHSSVRSAEDAYEQVGEPALLMEYLYLLTHGELLRHRLRGQIRVLQQHHDDAHLTVLRLATFAHACGVPLPAAALFEGRPEDPQRVLSQVDGEYVRQRGDDLAELHRVRSEHLAALLHDGGPSPTDTARRILPLLPDDRLGPFVVGALRYPGVDRDGFYPTLAQLAVTRGPATMAALADGLFEFGERDYSDAVSGTYDQAEVFMGSPGPFFLSTLLAPNQEPQIFDDLISTADLLPNGAGERFRILRAIADEAPEADRGYDRVRPLLVEALPQLSPEALLVAPDPAGRLLQEAHRLGFPFPHADALLDLLTPPTPDAVPAFASLILGLYDHAPVETERWVRQHADTLGYAVAEHLTLVGPPELSRGPEGPAVDIVFYPSDADGAPSLNEQAVSRLRLIRELYPFAVHFRSRAHWLLPDLLVPTHDESIKDMIPKYLRPRLFRDRQGLWNVLGKERGASPTLWAYQQAWHDLRTLAVSFAEVVEQAIRAAVEGRSFDLNRALSRGDLEDRLHQALRSVAEPPAHASAELVEALKGAKAWETPFSNVVSQITEFAKTKSLDTGRVLRYNAYETAAKVEDLHRAFDALFGKSPDSFNLRDLRDREHRSYAELAGAIEFWADPPVSTPVRSLRKALREVHGRRDDALRIRVESVLHDADITPSLPPTVLRDRLNQTVVLALPIKHPCDPEPAVLVDALFAIAELDEPSETDGRPDEVWITLTAAGYRFQKEAFRFFSHQFHRIDEDGDLNWESFAPLPPSERVAAVLDAIPFHVLPVYEAWKAAYGASFLGAHIEEYQKLDDTAHPRAFDHLPDLLRRSEWEMKDVAARLRTVCGGSSVPASAADRLDRIAAAFGQGDVLTDEILSLIDDLERHASVESVVV